MPKNADDDEEFTLDSDNDQNGDADGYVTADEDDDNDQDDENDSEATSDEEVNKSVTSQPTSFAFLHMLLL